MVEAGNLTLVGTLDTTDIERGQRKIQVGFDNVEAKTSGTVQQFDKLGKSSSDILSTFVGLGTAGVGALTALGFTAPAVAKDLADMKITMTNLGMAIGEIIQPAVEFLSDKFSDLQEFIEENKDTIQTFVTEGIEQMEDAIDGVQKVWDFFKDSFNNLSATISLNLEMDELLKKLVSDYGLGAAAAIIAKGAGLSKKKSLVTGGATQTASNVGDEESGTFEDIGSIAGFLGTNKVSKGLQKISGFALKRIAPKFVPYVGQASLLYDIGSYAASSSAGAWVGRQVDNMRQPYEEPDTEGGNVGG